jgi:hypothetical protein
MRSLLPILCVACMLHAAPFVVFANHPLITDDTGTQGKGKSQLEFDGQEEYGNRDGIKETDIEITPMLSYGLADAVDLIVSAPYDITKTEQSGETTREKGSSDLSLQVKWHFYEQNGLSFAVKPGITLPTGNDHKGLGTGKVTYGVYFIATKDLKPWAFHGNLGYVRNENTQNARKDIWYASLASELQVRKNLKLVGNFGVQRGDDPDSPHNPAFLLGGLVYSLTENVDIDSGYKYGFTGSDAVHTILAGITFRF